MSAPLRTRLDLGTTFAYRAGESRRRDPRRMRLAAAGAASAGAIEQGPAGQPRHRDEPAAPDVPLRVIEKPDFLIFAVLEARGGPSNTDQAALAAARHLADLEGAKDQGAVVALTAPDSPGLDGAGADRSIVLPSRAGIGFAAERLTDRLETAANAYRPRHIIFPETPAMRDVAARLALALDVSPAFAVHAFDGDACVRRGFGGAKDLQEPTPRVVTVMDAAAPPVARERFEARPLEVDWPSAPSDPRIEDLGPERIAADDIVLEEAPFILSAGAGVTDWDAFSNVATRLNATRAGTRVVCDWGLMERDRQVGASGRIVNADVYVALGISGAVQHVQGIERCECVVAVNIDAAAPIMKRADFAIVGDVNAILAALREKLEARP
ncbi:MAG: electron transfer flavoprotein subunit alpha/FixB family protein [Sphingomonadales bacterium]|nr:electron transfer flavoprotein subunit alpha/FixB family protein [Sphingomonadales bacterium]